MESMLELEVYGNLQHNIKLPFSERINNSSFLADREQDLLPQDFLA